MAKTYTRLIPVSRLTPDQSGQAIVVVITVLSMLFIIGVAFFSLSHAERAASIRNLDSLKSRYITEAGIAFARKILRDDTHNHLVDSLSDSKFTRFLGTDVDVDGDGKSEGKWFKFVDREGNPLGRFSIKIIDEASKVNVNTSDKGIIEQLFSQFAVKESSVDALVSGRPFNAIEEMGPHVGKEDFAVIKDYLTVYSRDREVDLSGVRRTYLNSSSARAIIEAFMSSGIRNPFTAAANLIDAADANLTQTKIDKFSLNNITPSSLTGTGGWNRNGDCYEAHAGGAPGTFTWSNLPLADGDYYCFCYGRQDTDVIGEVEQQSVVSGEGLSKMVTVSGGSFTLQITPAKDEESRFSHVELASLTLRDGLKREVVTGTEALVINELLPKLTQSFQVEVPPINPGQNFVYTVQDIKPGYYYVQVMAKAAGGPVGNVMINDRSSDALKDGDYFPFTVIVGSDRKIVVEVKNNTLQPVTFKGITMSQEPDGEFIELLNLSPSDINISNFAVEVYSLSGNMVPGWPARIPEGTTIRSYEHLVLAVDANDNESAPAKLKFNNISVSGTWGVGAVQLAFGESQDSIDKSFDILPNDGARVILKDSAGNQIDAVEYTGSQVNAFVSIERGDPTAKKDAEGNGFFDGWYISKNPGGATPAGVNDNDGMASLTSDGQSVKHAPSEVVVFNRPLVNLSEVMQISSGLSWDKFSLLDLCHMADHFSLQAVDLPLAGHYSNGEFVEKDGIFESSRPGDAGIWEFQDIPPGNYLLNIISDETNEAGQAQVAYSAHSAQSPEQFPGSYTLLFTDQAATYGRIDLASNPSMLSVRITNNLGRKLVLKALRLEPVSFVAGRININTASEEVLQSVLNSTSLSKKIIDNRPLGNKDGRKLGLGELFLLSPDFLPFDNQLTVKSDVYEIDCRGEYMPAEKTLSYQFVRSVVERSAQ